MKLGDPLNFPLGIKGNRRTSTMYFYPKMNVTYVQFTIQQTMFIKINIFSHTIHLIQNLTYVC